MEQIFANPGFKHIADQIISYLDLKSMVNFKKVNQTIASHFKSTKTCQLFFEKLLMNIDLEELGQSYFFNGNLERFSLLKSNRNFDRFKPFQKCDSFKTESKFKYGKLRILILDPWKREEIDQDLMKDLDKNQKLQCNSLWKMYRMINRFHDEFAEEEEKHDVEVVEVNDDKIFNIVAERLRSTVQEAYKNMNECPLILAIESRQESLVEKMLENGILDVCHCTDLNSIFEFGIKFWPSLAIYILRSDLLPLDKNDFQKCLESVKRKRKCHEAEFTFVMVSKSKADKIYRIKQRMKSKRRRIDPETSSDSGTSESSGFLTHGSGPMEEWVLAKDLRLIE